MQKRILLVDDSPLVHQMYGYRLEEAGFEVLHAEDGISGINQAFMEMPDLILLDIKMPKMNGYQVCRLLKDQAATKHIPIIIVTSQTSRDMVADPRKWSFQTGADSYFDKDSGETLVEALRPFLEGAAARPASCKQQPMSETQILLALSELLDKQLYLDVTRLKELDERKNSFVANVSHEFKSPLAVITMSCENMMDGLHGPIPDAQQRNLQIVKNAANRLARLVHDLLDLSQIEAGKMTLKKETIRMAALVQEVIETYALSIEEKKMKVRIDIPSDLPTLEGDKDRLMQAIINIFSK